MSREAFSHDPHDTRERSPLRAVRGHRPAPSRPRDEGNARSDTAARQQRGEHREPERTQEAPNAAERAYYYLRDRAYLLRDSEIHSLKEIGKFRVIAVTDLARYAYGGDAKRTEKEIGHLKREHLVSEKTLEISRKNTLRVVTLTKASHRLLKRTSQLPDEQAIYHGLLRSREAKHDADLYPLYQKEAARIERAGGRALRVILDYEIKRDLNRDLALLGAEKDNLDRKAEIAEKHGLAMVGARIPVPDMRLEYQDAELLLERVDLELATRDYRPRALAEKAKAGFAIYGRAEDASRLRRILDERELAQEILTL
jgi:hypothetical protein